MRELLLCPPDYYGIEYEINPWMSIARGAEARWCKSNGNNCTRRFPNSIARSI